MGPEGLRGGVDVQLPDVALAGAMNRYGDFCIHAVLDVARAFDEETLRRAYEATLESFPVLGRRYVHGFRRDRWAPLPEGAPDGLVVEAPEHLDDRTEAWLARRIDITRERQLRVVALKNGAATRFVLSVMHVAVDGAGVGAVGHVFGAHLYGRAPELAVERRRDVWRTLAALRPAHVPILALGMAKSLMVPLRQLRAAPRAVPYATAPAPAARGVHHELVLDKETVDALRARCGGVSVNDLLVAAFARAAAERSPSGPALVTYTIDLRRYGGVPALIAANTSSILSAVVPREALDSIESAARAVAKITKGHRDHLQGPATLLALYGLGSTMPHWLARAFALVMGPIMVDLPLSRGLMMTNVGRIDHGLAAFGDDVKKLRIVGPTLERVPVPIVVAFGFRGAVHLSFYAEGHIPKSALLELEAELRRALT